MARGWTAILEKHADREAVVRNSVETLYDLPSWVSFISRTSGAVVFITHGLLCCMSYGNGCYLLVILETDQLSLRTPKSATINL